MDRSPSVRYYFTCRSATESYRFDASLFHRKAKSAVAVVDKNACSDRLWLALADGPACPKVDGWATSSLFGASPARSQPGYPTRSFCRYEAPRKPSGCAIAALQAESKLHALVPRCAVVEEIAAADVTKPSTATTGGSLAPKLPRDPTAAQLDEIQSSRMAKDFLHEVGDTDLPHLGQETPNVRLMVLDTVATGEGVPDSLPGGGSSHGFGISHIAHELACDDIGCAAKFATQLAVPLSEAGAGYGTPGDLAAAIRAAVDGWLASPGDPKQRPHLVLNLSLGWDPKVLHEQLGAIDHEDHLNAEELAVYDALAYAAEKGALAITAVGNKIGGPNPEIGATLPAGWYAQPPVIPLLPPSAETVVWAVGGVARGGQRLANARDGSEPALVTYGDHAVVKLSTGGYTKPLTGTSVSAAVASSTAAVVWHLRPELSGREVMALLSSSGSDLGRSAELYRTNGADSATAVPAPPVRKLDLMAALDAALAPKVALARAAESRSLGCHLLKVSPEKIPASCPQRTYLTCDGVAPICTAESLPPKPAPGAVVTQPGANPCPACSIDNGGGGRAALQIEIDPDWNEGCLTDPMLEVETADGGKIGIPFTIENQLCPGDHLRIEDLDLPASIAAARISFKMSEQNYSIQSPVLFPASSSR
ncbi:MAG TPA: S8/S53 family peptidase [Thermoanaerobaculia bacterium]|jgi:hypothetical protein|nr:S8/S53 family peptidase [Thermoanaerobaculia bacterium]